MAKTRFFLHPVLSNEQSRKIFAYFLVLSLCIGTLLWVYVEKTIKKAGIDLDSLPPSLLLTILLSHNFRVSLILLSAILSAGLTAKRVVGPVKRIEIWTKHWESGHPLPVLRIRNKDKFSLLVELLNELYKRTSKHTR